jgi:uncharacterized membrane protein HdeD (DUF308 family)
MLSLITKNWWMVVLRGVFAILFGLMAWTWPGVTLGVLVTIWGIYAFADGILALAAAFSGATGRPWWTLLLEGLVCLGAAGVAFFEPGVTALVLLYIIAWWAIVTGVLEIVAAVQLRKEIEGEFWLGLAGLGSVLFGLFLMIRPGEGALAVTWVIGVYAVLFGVFLVALGFRLKGLRDLVARPAV